MINIKERLTRKIDINQNGCWVFRGFRLSNGYGRIQGPSGLSLAHRASWEAYRGPIPSGLCVLHLCDNPPCVNPEHLFLGTQRDNVLDMLAKGRDRHATEVIKTRGEKHWRCKLTREQVLEIRRRRSEPQKQLAAEFGTTQRYISSIVCGRKWKWLQ